MSQTETIATEYGDIKVDIIECDSCGQTVREENAVKFTIGERSGYACEHCEETGPVDFPGRVREFTLPKEKPGEGISDGAVLGPVFHIVFAWLALPVNLHLGFTSGGRFANGYAIGAVVVFVWLVLPLLAYMVFL